MEKHNTIKELQKIPGVGPRMAQDLVDLGYAHVEELQQADPEAMYNQLCMMRGAKIDRCVLYVFRCAVYFASHTQHDPHLLKWWHWKDRTFSPR